MELTLYGDNFKYHQEPILKAFEATKEDLPFNARKPLAVDIYSPDLLLIHRMVLIGTVTLAMDSLLPKKAATVAYTGRRIPEAIETAKELAVTLLGGWVPAGLGTDFHGGSPFYEDGDIWFIVAVSGQNHMEVDQPFADAIVHEYEKIPTIQIP